MNNHKYLTKRRKDSLEISRLIDIAGLSSESNVLDFGCGPGLFFEVYKNKNIDNVVGYDINEEFIKYCSSTYQNYTFTTKLPTSKFTNIIMSNVYHHLEQRDEVMKKLFNLLTENGIITIVEFKKKELDFGPNIDHKIDSEQVKEELDKYCLVTEVDFNEYYYVLKYKRK